MAKIHPFKSKVKFGKKELTDIFRTNFPYLRKTQTGTSDAIKGIHFEIKGRKFITVSTDAHRMIYAEFQLEKGINGNAEFTVSDDEIKAIKKLPEDEIQLLIGKGIYFYGGGEVEVKELKDTFYPNFRQVIPTEKSFVFSARINREKLLQSVKRLLIIGDKGNKSSVGLFIFTDDLLSISRVMTVDDIKQECVDIKIEKDVAKDKIVKYKHRGKAFEIHFEVYLNLKFIEEFLRTVMDEEIIFNGTGSLSPVVFQVESEIFDYIVMPIRNW